MFPSQSQQIRRQQTVLSPTFFPGSDRLLALTWIDLTKTWDRGLVQSREKNGKPCIRSSRGLIYYSELHLLSTVFFAIWDTRFLHLYLLFSSRKWKISWGWWRNFRDIHLARSKISLVRKLVGGESGSNERIVMTGRGLVGPRGESEGTTDFWKRETNSIICNLCVIWTTYSGNMYEEKRLFIVFFILIQKQNLG